MLLCRNPHSGEIVPPFAPALPLMGLTAHSMHPHFLYGTLPTKIVFTEQKLRPPRGVLRGGGKHRKGGWGQFAPIITSNDFPRANIREMKIHQTEAATGAPRGGGGRHRNTLEMYFDGLFRSNFMGIAGGTKMTVHAGVILHPLQSCKISQNNCPVRFSGKSPVAGLR